ncbi:MAG: plastocyanin/azurin family copper-binding protein [Kofleriaceae bacterium]
MLKPVSIALFLIAACGGDDPASPDAPPGGGSDAAPATVMAVACSTGEPTIVTRNGANMYDPSAVTIAVGQVVKFVNSSNHNVAPLMTMSDAGLDVGFGATKCLKFTAAGSFKFKCTPHEFVGTITVN